MSLPPNMFKPAPKQETSLSAEEIKIATKKITDILTNIMNEGVAGLHPHYDLFKKYILENKKIVKDNIDTIVKAHLEQLTAIKAVLITHDITVENYNEFSTRLHKCNEKSQEKFINTLKKIGFPEEMAKYMHRLCDDLTQNFQITWYQPDRSSSLGKE